MIALQVVSWRNITQLLLHTYYMYVYILLYSISSLFLLLL